MKTRIEIYSKGYMAATLTPEDAIRKIQRQNDLKEDQCNDSINKLKDWLTKNISLPGSYTNLQIGKNAYIVQVKETCVTPAKKQKA